MTLVALARSPRSGSLEVVRNGTIPATIGLVAIATAISIARTLRFASEVSVQDVMFGPDRVAAIGPLIATLGRDLSAVVLYLLESSWNAFLVVSAVSPVLYWLLGATAIQAAAQFAGIHRPTAPAFVLIGHATALTRPLADLAGLALGFGGAGGSIAGLLGTVSLVWLGVVAWHGIRAIYDVPGGRATAILVVAIALFYLAPLAVIVLAVVAIVLAAVILEYFPAP